MPDPHPHRPNPRASRWLRAALTGSLLAVLGAAAVPAQQGWAVSGALSTGDRSFNRPYLYNGTCLLSSVGTAVRFDVHDIVLADPTSPADLAANLCSGTAFDSVLYLYQWPDGSPGGFNPLSPCTRLVLYNDDFCGSQSSVSSTALVPGHAALVVTSFANDTFGNYTLSTSSSGSPLSSLIFYGSFEIADTLAWSATVGN